MPIVKSCRYCSNWVHTGPVPLPDVSSKQLAQAYLGIDLEDWRARKDVFLDEVVPQWLSEAAARHDRWDELPPTILNLKEDISLRTNRYEFSTNIRLRQTYLG